VMISGVCLVVGDVLFCLVAFLCVCVDTFFCGNCVGNCVGNA